MAQLSPFSPIWGNTHFKPGSHDPGFKKWAESGFSKIMDLYNNEDIYKLEDTTEISGETFFHLFGKKTVKEHMYSDHQISILYSLLLLQ